ncbi:type II toxin-antitoxin system RelE/ParE family toxin [Xanthomonas sp. WHRI 8812E]|uniref:type II toxin-antitoxin system RelE/ParE family toxin n=1 Tax=Xanthomonas sp. WHRI 8812E TaxID=3059651 RepID=UPI0032E4AC9A
MYWTPSAHVRLLEIQTYLKEHAPSMAKAVTVALARRALKPGHSPAMGRALHPLKCGSCWNALTDLIYRVTPTQVDILTVLHYRQLMPSDLTDLQR